MDARLGPAGGRLVVLRDGAVLRVVLDGGVDLMVRERDAPALWTELADPELGAVDLDAGAVTFLDSSGLSVLVRLARDAAERGLPLRLVAVSPVVEYLLDRTGVRGWMDEIAAAPGPAR